MRRIPLLVLLLLAGVTAASWLIVAGPARAYVISNYWPDSVNIVFDDVFLPANVWSAPAQFQMSEWNTIDTTDNSHPFRINTSPQFSFGANDGDNTIGFLGQSGLGSEYGLSYATALAWTVCWAGFGGRYDECDVMLDPTLPWNLSPDDDYFFQSTVLHELGHVRGLDHYNSYLSIENSGVNKILRGENLYMDDRVAIRQHASHVPETDIVFYNKYHTGSVPAWMTANRTTARVGETITFHNLTVENRGTTTFGSLRFGIYMSTNDVTSTADQLVSTGNFSSFGTFSFSTFDWTVTVPSVNDCGTRYFGGIIDDVNAYGERYEGNNAVTFVNGSPSPQPFTILLARDGLEPNDSFGAARTISLPFSNSSLSLDSDTDQDFYRFTLTQASQVTATLNFDHSLGDVDFDLRNASNAVLASSTGVGNSETITINLQPGTYTYRVYGAGSGSCNRYSMTASASATGGGGGSLGVSISTNQSVFTSGQVVSPTVVITNPGLPAVAADWYAGYLRPDNTFLFYTGGYIPGALNNPASWQAVATAYPMDTPFSVTITNAFPRQFTPFDPHGTYTLMVIVMRAGTSPSTGGPNLLAIASVPVSYP